MAGILRHSLMCTNIFDGLFRIGSYLLVIVNLNIFCVSLVDILNFLA